MSGKRDLKTYQKPTVESVELESSVIFKIVKHTSENYSHPVSGSLFGFDKEDGVLNVSHSLPFPNYDQVEGVSFRSKSNLRYQQEYFDQLREIGYGVESFGWYQSTISGNFITNPLVEALINQRLINKNSFVLVNNLSNFQKSLNLKAFRLTENFLKTYASGKFQTASLIENELEFTNIFEEIPLTIHNSALVDLYLKSASIEAPTSNLNLNNNSTSLIYNLESLFESIDDLNYEQNNINYYQRQHSREMTKINQWKLKRKQENAQRAKNGEKELDVNEWQTLFKLPTEPSRYDSLLISGGINKFVNDLQVSGDSELVKTFAIKRELDI